jgi:hypothetical protein
MDLLWLREFEAAGSRDSFLIAEVRVCQANPTLPGPIGRCSLNQNFCSPTSSSFTKCIRTSKPQLSAA